MSAARRRLLVRAGIVALVFTAVVIVPAYISLQPRFLQRYPNLNPEYRTWSTSVHAKVRCQACHVPPELTAQSAYGVRMLGEFYLSAVLRSRELKILSTPTNAACSSCHIDLRTVSPSGDLNIPHRAHVGVLKLKCVRCHEYLVHEKSPEGKHAPRMTGCLTCHDGRQAKNACSTCHTDKGAPVSHRSPEWVVVHPLKQKNLDCKKCHAWTGNWCAECHSRRPKSHVAKWRSKHPLQVKARRNCEACHEAPFCIRCHGEVPQLNFNPALKLVE
ncbi:MAG: cytochrome c3 family protein [Actinomycetota bacterium]|nr:cytochrome c3 family protein [Actinomycetota bacterium]